MKKILICLLVFNLLLPGVIKAEEIRYGYVRFSNVPILLSAEGEVLTENEDAAVYEQFERLAVIEETEEWFKVEKQFTEGEIQVWISKSDFVLECELDDLGGFPIDYRENLRKLQILHPSWAIVPYETGIEWETMITKESRLGYNLINDPDPIYRSTAVGAYDPATGEYIPYDGKNWYCANRETIAYYIDPRNWLNETNIFMFLKLGYNSNETAQVVQKTLNGTFMEGSVDGNTYAEIFVSASQEASVSAVYLATLAKQEQGTKGSKAITGEEFTYNGKTYKNLYNFFNIGATGGTDNWKKGLVFANGGEDGSATSYDRPWNTPAKAIIGGAKWIAKGYIVKGQDTMYTQKFNCTPKSTFTHQYMTNVRAAKSQSAIMFNTYSAQGNLDTDLTFSIPVYKNMPAEVSQLPTENNLPGEGEQERDPEIISEDPENPVEYTGDLIVDLDLLNESGMLSGWVQGMTYAELKTKLAVMYESKPIKISTNGKEIKDDDILSTGQILEFEGSTYTIVIRGDLTGDGKINSKDALAMKKHILSAQSLNGAFQKAGLLNGEKEINMKAYLIMKKHILEIVTIEQ